MESCEAGDRVGCEGGESLALDDGLDFFPGARCKEHFADAAAMGVEASADAGEDDLESAVATEFVDIEDLTVDEDGEMGCFPPASDKLFHDTMGFRPQLTRVGEGLCEFEECPAESITTSARPLEEATCRQGRQEFMCAGLGQAESLGDFSDTPFRALGGEES